MGGEEETDEDKKNKLETHFLWPSSLVHDVLRFVLPVQRCPGNWHPSMRRPEHVILTS